MRESESKKLLGQVPDNQGNLRGVEWLSCVISENARNVQSHFRKKRIKPQSFLEEISLECSDINEHVVTLFLLTRLLRLRSVLELGTRTGTSTLALLEACKETDGMVTSIDINPCPIAHERIEGANLLKHWRFVQGDDLRIPWASEINHLFIDTTHEYEHTLMELERFEPFVPNGGIITLHDSDSCAGVRRAVNEFTAARSDLRVCRYFNNNGLDVIIKT